MITALKTEPKVQGVSYRKPHLGQRVRFQPPTEQGSVLEHYRRLDWASRRFIAAHKNRAEQEPLLPCFRQERDLQG